VALGVRVITAPIGIGARITTVAVAVAIDASVFPVAVPPLRSYRQSMKSSHYGNHRAKFVAELVRMADQLAVSDKAPKST
jgi:hypothetical protein